MVDKICDRLMARVRLKMPEVDEERAEVIRYGFELIIGELPKVILMFIFALLLGRIKYFLISGLVICTYRTFSGGIHLKSHIGCFIGTNLLYLGNVFLSEAVKFPNDIMKFVFYMSVYIFSLIVIFLYVPADTDTVPILRKKDRKKKKIISIVFVTIDLIVSYFIKDYVIANICVIGVLLQSLTTMRILYKIFHVKYGYLDQMNG